MTDFSAYTLPQLFDLQKEIAAAIEQRKVSEKRDAIAAIKKLAAENGFSLEELLGAAGKAGKSTSTGVAKYRNPADASQTWTGRGRKPQWVVDFLATGAALDQLAI
ncbi:DNA-binding protein H-NS [Andreprevotia lacus DSM 23236]|jgi:DNA-binding protein H-NS|uniref:DNA-binding protein H-NS n=1 Tax=Andreprevotia lacus DSM 23236 TaxID=1121001 RepID=A0A1W1X748_9NEIS|nr:H-NS histone family protein [Andreprevotia lacus]SMC19766.1 DNA-binding protein H-NS [Andreprevotia lacus DSM 23236]